MTIEGEIIKIGIEQRISDTFAKRYLWIWHDAGEGFGLQEVAIEFQSTRTSDNMGLPGAFQVGDDVRVYFVLKSKDYRGNTYTNAVGHKIESI